MIENEIKKVEKRALHRGARFKDLSGRKFGRLTIISPDQVIGKRWYWICECDCTKKTIISASSKRLLNGQIKSCGCLHREVAKRTHSTGHGEITGSYFASIRSRASQHEFNITIEYIWELFLKQERKCALTGLELRFERSVKTRSEKTASLDRIDSSKGYIIGNVQWVHQDINWMKQDFSDEVFIEYCQLVAANFQNQKK